MKFVGKWWDGEKGWPGSLMLRVGILLLLLFGVTAALQARPITLPDPPSVSPLRVDGANRAPVRQSLASHRIGGTQTQKPPVHRPSTSRPSRDHVLRAVALTLAVALSPGRVSARDLEPSTYKPSTHSPQMRGPIEQDFERGFGRPSAFARSLVAPVKTTGLSVDAVKAIIEEDFRSRQYFITGNLTPSVYADDCRFQDPTTDVRGLQRYIFAVSNLFEPGISSVELLSIVALSDTQIKSEWVLQGSLKLPWKPFIPAVHGSTIYSLNGDGLIVSHAEEWDVSAWAAALAVVGIRTYGDNRH